jgi:predicted nuclease of predicted toxin-antitoxin system
VRLLLDEHVAPVIAAELRRRGHDVVAVAERPDLGGSAGGALWLAARREGRVLVTRDVQDFMRLVAADRAVGRAHPGLLLIHRGVFTRRGRDVGRLVKALDALLAAHPGDSALDSDVAWLQAEEW